MQFTIIGNPENRRVSGFCQTVQQLGYEIPAVIPYASWLLAHERPVIPPQSIVRIDSPGENDAVRQLLVARGRGETIPAASLFKTTKPADYGIIKDLQTWYAGFSHWLQEMETIISEQPHIRVMNHPADIRLQFNKPVCQALLEQHGVPVPARLPAFASYDELLSSMQERGLQKVFIKPAHASSASGVIAFRRSGHRVQAVTSAEMISTPAGLQLYNSLQVRTYTNEQVIASLINRMIEENVFAEEWLPKATLKGRYFDVRVLVIAGKARHTVIRTSSHIITNLHLGNKRGDMNNFVTEIGANKLMAIKQLAEQAAACFPESLYMGIDILLTADLRKTVVLEINAFGDLLPNLLDEGETCYEAQIRAMIKKQEQAALC
jgi:glutathione synthase/RimK-type ligase-like ATP-grasp enzyme